MMFPVSILIQLEWMHAPVEKQSKRLSGGDRAHSVSSSPTFSVEIEKNEMILRDEWMTSTQQKKLTQI